MTATVTHVAQAEEQLYSAIRSAAGELNRIGTTRIENALAELQAAAQAARARIAHARACLAAVLQGVAGVLEEAAIDVQEDLSTDAVLATYGPLPGSPTAPSGQETSHSTTKARAPAVEPVYDATGEEMQGATAAAVRALDQVPLAEPTSPPAPVEPSGQDDGEPLAVATAANPPVPRDDRALPSPSPSPTPSAKKRRRR